MNILIDEDSVRLDNSRATTLVEAHQINMSSLFDGPLRYIAPELIEKTIHPTIASDIYAFGHVCTEVWWPSSV